MPSFTYHTCVELVLRTEKDRRQLLMAVKEGGCGAQRAGGKLKNILCEDVLWGKLERLKEVEDNIKIDLKEENI